MRYSAVEDLITEDKRTVISVFCALVSTTEIRHVSLAEENESEVQE
jgi:hypothetical protein